MSCIVVSDVHLGSKSCNYKQFCEFLKWVRKLEDQEVPIKCGDKEVAITSPEKFILLGDILELWDPKDGDRDNVVRQSIRPFSLLSDIGCEKIYVIGNHDDAIHRYDEKIDYETLHNDTTLNVCNRHYPETCPEYLEIGERSYFFIHGHQYDKGQIPAFVLRLTGMRWDPLNWFQVLFNIPFTKKYWILNSLIFLALVFGGWMYLWDSALKSNFGYTLIWAVLTGFFALCSIPAIFTKSQRTIYNLRKPKDKTAQQIIEDKYYKEQKDTVVADVIVFGHTHFASSHASSHEGKKKLFINSGCWVKEKDCIIDGKQRYTNTFVYIDESGAYILKWNDGKIDCIEAFPISKG
jgi:UDP-2,3-diacylglucosamine pyrophosphatase LpxH